ncbi:LegC family aminotransferase [Bacteroidota bacterium]
MNSFFEETLTFIRKLYNQPKGFIPLHAPVFNGNEKKYLVDCIDSSFVSSIGKFVDQFEEEMAAYTGATKAVVCVNGTNALHLALKLIGVSPDTEVITQALTFIATVNPIAYCNANPVFLDVDKNTLGLSSEKLEHWLKNNIKFDKSTQNPINKSTNKIVSACLPMHTFGHPCKIDEIIEICKNYNIPVVEDAAESLGSFYKDQHTGTFGDIGILSFNGNKILTTGGGGMLLFRNADLAKKAKHITTQAKVPHPWEFVHDEVGYNYRMPNINAALGLAQLEQLPDFIENKRKTASNYKSFFEKTEVDFIKEPQNTKSNYWLNTILLKDLNERNEFLKYTNDNEVMTRPAWALINKLHMFRNFQTGDLSNAEYFEDRIVNLPSSVIL